MTEHAPDVRSLIDGSAQDSDRDAFARAHELLVRVERLPELPGTLLQPAAVALRQFRARQSDGAEGA